MPTLAQWFGILAFLLAVLAIGTYECEIPESLVGNLSPQALGILTTLVTIVAVAIYASDETKASRWGN
jgi:hypothetical protein